jgi:hypothetical protein
MPAPQAHDWHVQNMSRVMVFKLGGKAASGIGGRA